MRKSTPGDPVSSQNTGNSESSIRQLARHWVNQRAILQNYDRFIVHRLKRHLGVRILEVGCGIGNMTLFLLDREFVVALDADAENIEGLRDRFGQFGNLRCFHADITKPNDFLREFQFDSVLCANVLEHISDDEQALAQIAALLPSEGNLVILVPSGPWLFGNLDLAAGHCRRYSSRELLAKVRRVGFEEKEVYWLNSLGILGWLFNGRLLGRFKISDWQLRLFDYVSVPIMSIESKLGLRFGLSLVVVCRNRQGTL